MKILSVDYGDARTGIAISDINCFLASPYCTIKESYQPKLVDKIIEIIKKENIGKLVIGLPRNMDGSYGYRCDECKALGTAITDKMNIEVCYEDERLTTVMAHSILSSNNVRGKKRKDTVDAVSAVMILQGYLDRNQ